jgi:hypothetical protein
MFGIRPEHVPGRALHDPKPTSGILFAPAASNQAMSFPGNRTLGVDEHLVVPETTRDELVRGRRMMAMPALPPHADRHCEVDYVVRANCAKGYVTSTDLLTRIGPSSNFATDTSVRREGIDPATGDRYLEELAFEVVSEQSNRDIRERAEDLMNRGVRRLIAIFVKQGEVREWSREQGGWITLARDSVLEDRTLARPVAIRALLDANAADDAVVDALDAKDNPRLTRIREQGLEQGLERAIEMACKLLDIPLGPAERAQLESLDLPALEVLLTHLETHRRWPSTR